MSASTSGKALLAAVRRGEQPDLSAVRAFGEDRPGEFFRDLIEPLSDSFDPAQVAAYEALMRAWIPARVVAPTAIPSVVDVVYVLSRVTLGADIKLVSPILATMKRRFPGARIVFVANRKSAELFAGDASVEHLLADYPRSGPVIRRLEFAEELRGRIAGANRIMVDPDSRMTQLGLVPVCEPDRYFHFPSRTIGGESSDNLSHLMNSWLLATFGCAEAAFIAPAEKAAGGGAAVSFGVGENESKRVGDDFEARVIAALGAKFSTVWVDRGVGGEEARRVTAAVEASGVADRVRFWEGGFAGFAAIIAASELYVGYDSAGQHAAAAAGVPLISLFAGAPSDRFRARWTAAGAGKIVRIVTDGVAPDVLLGNFGRVLT